MPRIALRLLPALITASLFAANLPREAGEIAVSLPGGKQAKLSDYAGKVRVGKVNIDDNQQVASEFGVSSIPTVIIFKNGQVVDRFVGVTPKSRLSAALDSHL